MKVCEFPSSSFKNIQEKLNVICLFFIHSLLSDSDSPCIQKLPISMTTQVCLKKKEKELIHNMEWPGYNNTAKTSAKSDVLSKSFLSSYISSKIKDKGLTRQVNKGYRFHHISITINTYVTRLNCSGTHILFTETLRKYQPSWPWTRSACPLIQMWSLRTVLYPYTYTAAHLHKNTNMYWLFLHAWYGIANTTSPLNSWEKNHWGRWVEGEENREWLSKEKEEMNKWRKERENNIKENKKIPPCRESGQAVTFWFVSNF